MRVSVKTLSLVTLAALFLVPVTAAASPESERLGDLIRREMRAGGPWFNAGESALIERKCGYAPGQWDGYRMETRNGVFICTNGRRVDDPEMRAMLHAAQPRIAARVRTVMASPVIRAAMNDVTREATERAMRRLRERQGD
jgi:hypothetical protein